MASSVTRLLSAGRAASLDDLTDQQLADAAQAGFEGLLWDQPASLFGERGSPPGELVTRCAAAGLKPILAIDLPRFPLSHPLVAANPGLFAIRRESPDTLPVDPRRPPAAQGVALARLRDARTAEPLLPALVEPLRRWLAEGLAGFLIREPERIAPKLLRRLIGQLRTDSSELTLIAGPVADTTALAPLASAAFDGLVSSVSDRTGGSAALMAEAEAARGVAPLFAEIGSDPGRVEAVILAAAATAGGIIVPLALLQQHPTAVAGAMAAARATESFTGEMRRLTGSASKVAALLRADRADIRTAERVLMVLINTTGEAQPAPDRATLLPGIGAEIGDLKPATGEADAAAPLAPGEVRLLAAERSRPITLPVAAEGAPAAARNPRLVIEDVTPHVSGGAFPVKRVVGESIAVDAKVFADGHEQLAAELLWRAADEAEWTAVRMEQLPNDGWRAAFSLPRLGRHEFLVEGWLDRFGGFRRDFRKKLDAGVAQPVDHAEGRQLVEEARDRSNGGLRSGLDDFARRLGADGADTAALLLSPELSALMDRADDRPHRTRSAAQLVDAERLQARFSSWYELFPRSITDDKHRHGTFADVIGRLPAIRDMGFDTLYFPPIHPIGTANRKGPNNTLTPGPDDPGSPYAVGSPEGGHDAIHPALGSFADFDRLVAAARDQGLEIALDFAIQCSPDHPWLKEHPGWFDWRPDGTIKYAENPPKKYQDIVNVDFYRPDAVPDLWIALRDVILLWIDHGVKTFRVDNPHTKPLPFWEWMIGEVRARHPDAIFLAEAFTRPTMMYRLAKVGFSQSYTYFTWRDRKGELVDYLTELTTTAPKEFYRPHFFVNTPDINPLFLQTSGRAGFRIRAVLAATLSGLFGVYSGFELCEAAPLPGREEYLDSEKYEIRPRDYAAPGNIIADITLLNRLRRAHPALQTHLNTRFYVAHNDNIIWYGKPSPDGTDMIMVMVSLDPHGPQEADFEVPLWEFGLPDDGSVAVEDLAEGYRFRWSGKAQHIRLDPAQPYRIWRIAPGDAA